MIHHPITTAFRRWQDELREPSPVERLRILEEIAALSESKKAVPQLGKAGPADARYGTSSIRVCHDPRKLSRRSL